MLQRCFVAIPRLCFILLCLPLITTAGGIDGDRIDIYPANNITVLRDDFYLDIDEISVSAGHFHTCAIEYRSSIDFGGPAKCWGRNDRGQTSSPAGAMFAQVSCGHLHTCALGVNETLSCWGAGISKPPEGLYTQ
eukprot:10979628-Ditylum_brightwellii.AAC.1